MDQTDIDYRDRQASLREAFRLYENDVALINARRAAIFSAVFMLAASSLDWVILPDKAPQFLVIRIICAVLIGFIFIYLQVTGSYTRAKLLAQGIALLPIIGICTMIAITDGGNSMYYAGLNLVLVGLSLLLRWNFRNSLFMILSCGAFYAASVIISPTISDYHILYGNSFFLFVTSVFVLAGSYFYEKLRFSEFCLREEVERSRQVVEQQNQKLSALDEAKTRFFANISHELRTPLTIMLGITERLKLCLSNGHDPASHQEMASMLEQNGLRLLKLIDDLLDLVRFDTGHADVHRQSTEIAPHIDGLLKSLRHLAEQDRVTLIWECQSDHNHLELDRDKFDKILLNLVINAIKFTPSGGSIEVTTKVSNESLQLTVKDSGVGIPPEVLPRIFERFWQVDTSSTRKFQGAGIGLALVRSLAEAMDGAVNVTSELNQGTTFSVELPVQKSDPERGAMAGATPETESTHGSNIAHLHRKAALSTPGKIRPSRNEPSPPSNTRSAPSIGKTQGARPLVLIADDEPDIRRFLKMQLGDVDVIEASDGAEAVELARLRRPQLALLDYMMPELDGMEVCRRIRENHSTRGMAIIVLTARADEQTKLSALQAGANDFLTKPFSTAELTLRLENQLTMARIRHELSELNTELQVALEQLRENESQMLQTEKLSALGRMSAGIIHEINNPLNYATVAIHTLATFSKSLPDEDKEDFQEILGDIREGVERVSQIVIDLRQFTREDNGITSEANLSETLNRARRMISHQIQASLLFDLECPDTAVVCGNSNQLVQVFINFFQNSIDAIQERSQSETQEPGRISVEVMDGLQNWRVTIRDNGIGIPAENVSKIFDPFFTSKDVGKGMGLGLSVSHQILRSHRAVVDTHSRPEQGTTFTISLPKSTFNDQSHSQTPSPIRTIQSSTLG